MQVLGIAREMKLLKLGSIALDGTKIKANASRHSALSHGHAAKLEAQLQEEVRELLARAKAVDNEPLPEGLNIPEELARREARLEAIRAAKAEIERRTTERDAEQRAAYEAKLKEREERAERTGKRPGGPPPAPPAGGVQPTAQVNLTDADSRIMPVPGGGFDQSYNAQAAVDVETMLVVARHITQAANDKHQIAPMLKALAQLPEALGTISELLADDDYFSKDNVKQCTEAGIEPLIALGREAHHLDWQERFTEPPPEPTSPDPVQRMRQRFKTLAGRARYALRKQVPEPVFGIIKSVMRFRQFSLRGLEAVRGEWSLVTMAWNIRRMAVLGA